MQGPRVQRSVVAVQHVALAVAVPVVVIVPISIAVVIAPAGDALFLIDTGRREVAGAGIGRPLLDIVLLRRHDGVLILHFGIGQQLKAGITWINWITCIAIVRRSVSCAARADITARSTARAGGRNARGGHG